MFVSVKNSWSKKIPPPPPKGPPSGQKMLKTHAPNDRENCQSVCCKILPEGTQGIAIEPFPKKIEDFPQMRKQEAPENEILPKNLFFTIFYTFSFLRFSIYHHIFSDLEFFFDLDPRFK